MPRFRLDEERENIFSLYQVLFPEILSSLIGTSIKHLIQEVPLNRRKIDVYGWAEEINENIFVEIQFGKADNRHLEKVKEIINDIETGIVIWESSSFAGREHFIEEVMKLVKGLEKSADVLFVEINPDVIPILEQLASLYPLDLISNLHLLTKVIEPLKIIAKYEGTGAGGEYKEAHGLRQQELIQLETRPLSTRLGANKYILRSIRKKMWYYPASYRGKSRMDTNALVFGAGNGNMFEISIRDSFSHVKLRIPNKNVSTCVQVKMDKMMIEKRIGYRINFKEERTSYIVDVPILSSAKRPRIEVLDEVVLVFKAFVEFFTKYFFEMESERKIVGAR